LVLVSLKRRTTKLLAKNMTHCVRMKMKQVGQNSIPCRRSILIIQEVIVSLLRELSTWRLNSEIGSERLNNLTSTYDWSDFKSVPMLTVS